MSFFYIYPAKGDIPVHLLETIISNRLIYLDAISRGQHPLYNEYVVEGSVYDNVGHYMLCIFAILEDNKQFTHYFLKTEETLFRYRLISLSAYDLRCLAKKILRNMKKHSLEAAFIDPLQKLCQSLMLRHVTHHLCSICNQSCSLHMICVKFNHCLRFVARREVNLKSGLAFIPCSQWKSYLILLFHDNLEHRLCNTQLDLVRSDPRITELLQKFRHKFNHGNDKLNRNILRNNEVDHNSKYFPPCMMNLHQHLRKKHRLSHNQRFYYSVFLKDIGMPVDEAVKFWQSEYAQVPCGTHVCSHNWKEDEKKYVYGIRHMYGLEGARKSYYSGDCHCIQNSDRSYSEGGCPFKSFDKNRMQQILSLSEKDSLFLKVCELKDKRQYITACTSFLEANFASEPNDCDILNMNFSPVKYYQLALNKL